MSRVVVTGRIPAEGVTMLREAGHDGRCLGTADADLA